MSSFAETSHENKSQSAAEGGEMMGSEVSQSSFTDNRPEANAQQSMQLAANSSPQVTQLMQLQTAVNSSQAPMQRQALDEGVDVDQDQDTDIDSSNDRDTDTSLDNEVDTSAGDPNDPFLAPLTEEELASIRAFRAANMVGAEELTDDPDHNHTIIANRLFYNRYIANDYCLQPNAGHTVLECLDPSVVLMDSRVPAFKQLVEAIGPIINWSAVPASDRQVKVMNELINKYGLPVNGAAGLVGNLVAESGVQPDRLEGSAEATPLRAPAFDGTRQDWSPEEVESRNFGRKEGPRLPGVGLAQWTTSDRREGLFEHEYNGEVLGVDILFNMDAQVDYLIAEMQSKYAGVYNVLTGQGVTVNSASDEVVYNFERPGKVLNDARTALLPRSHANVQEVFAVRRRYSNQALAAYQAALPPEPVGLPPQPRPGGGPF